MGQQFTQRFWVDRRPVAGLHRHQRWGRYLGVLMLATACLRIAPMAAAPATGLAPVPAESTPRHVLLAQAMMDLPAVNSADVLIPSLPPASLPANQFPTVNVPPLQPVPTGSPSLATPEQLELQPADTPALGSAPIIEFGQPLPKAKAIAPVSTPQ